MARLLRCWTWLKAQSLDLRRHMRLAYLPPLMVYMAAGISGLTSIVSTFFVKDYLGLSAEFLAAIGFWAGLPWALKMPLGHLVDLLWRWKALFVCLGAALITVSILIMRGLLQAPDLMASYLSASTWFVCAALLAPLGYVIQDVVADAMTVEAVPVVDAQGHRYDEPALKGMHTTMQTLGRVAVVGGGIAVSLVNLVMFQGVQAMTAIAQVDVYIDIYQMALGIPILSVLGVLFGAIVQAQRRRRRRRQGVSPADIADVVTDEAPMHPNWGILGGSLAFVLFTFAMGLSPIPFNQEIIFAGSMVIVVFLMLRLVRELAPPARRTLMGTAIIIFVFRALPLPGAGATWWQIDVLGFDQHFLAQLSLISGSLALLGMLVFRRFMAEKSIVYVVGSLTLIGTVLSLPLLGMYYGLHEWTASWSGGIIDARFIAIIDTALESPLGQVAMIPMLAWIANSAPSHLKATFFAVMASFTNLALSLSQLGTKYVNQWWTVTREVRETATGAMTVPADYSELGMLLMMVTLLSLVLPLLTLLIVQASPLHSRD